MQKTVLLGVGALAVFGAVVLFSLIGYVVNLNNTWVGYEESLKMQYKQNQNNYSSMLNKVMEVAQVPQQYTKDLESLFKTALSTRYGENGSKAMFQMLTEQNPNLDASMYKEIQLVIQSSRTSFEADQKMLLDKKLVYEKSLREFPGSLVAGFLGYPKINLKDYDIVTSEATSKAFESKKAEPMNVFQK